MHKIILTMLVCLFGCGTEPAPETADLVADARPNSAVDMMTLLEDAGQAGPDSGFLADAGLDAGIVSDAEPDEETCLNRRSDREDGQLRVRGCRFVRDGLGTVMPRGIFVSTDSLTRASQSPLHEAQHYEDLASGGFDTVWLLVLWSGLEPQEGVFDAAYMGRICQQSEFARLAGLDVVLTMYQDGLGKPLGGHGFPAWFFPGADSPSSDTSPLSARYAPYWRRFWAGEYERLVAAWERLLETCGAEAGVLGITPLSNPVATTAEVSSVQHFHDEVSAAARRRLGSVVGFIEPILTPGGVVWPGPEDDVALSTSSWGPGRGPSDPLDDPAEWYGELQAQRAWHGSAIVVRSRVDERISASGNPGVGINLWADGFAGESGLRDLEGEPTERLANLGQTPWPQVVSGRVHGFRTSADGWQMEWDSDLSNEGLTRIYVGAAGAQMDVTLMPNELTWFSSFDPVTQELQVFVQESEQRIQLSLVWSVGDSP